MSTDPSLLPSSSPFHPQVPCSFLFCVGFVQMAREHCIKYFSLSSIFLTSAISSSTAFLGLRGSEIIILDGSNHSTCTYFQHFDQSSLSQSQPPLPFFLLFFFLLLIFIFHKYPPASASTMLGLKVCATTPG